MKKTIRIILMVLSAGAITAQASLQIGAGASNSGSLPSYTWTVTDLNNPTPTVAGPSNPLIAGSLTQAGGAAESFSMVLTGASDWNAISAQTAIASLSTNDNAFATYLTGLTEANIDYGTLDDALGVVGGNSERLDVVGEAIICTFGAGNLASGTLVLNNVAFDRAHASDRIDYLIYDASAKTVNELKWDGTMAFPAGEYAVDTGDVLIMGYGASDGGEVRFDGLTMDVIPEPATLSLVAVFGGGLLLIRRRIRI